MEAKVTQNTFNFHFLFQETLFVCNKIDNYKYVAKLREFVNKSLTQFS